MPSKQNRPVGRDGYFSPFVIARVLQLNSWNYVGCTYDSETGMASIWGNGELARELHIGVAEVASRHSVRVAVRDGDDRCFAGRIACLQLYDYAMTQEQIAAARDACKGHKPTSCAEAKSLRSNANDGEYILYPFSTDSDVALRVYCHDMASGEPKEFLTLPSGPDENYAIFFADRLVDASHSQCTGSLQEVIVGDIYFLMTPGPNDVAYGHAGDCYSAKQGCAKGTFKVDLTGTGLALAPEVHWVMGDCYPADLTINDMFLSEDRKVASARCGGWCGYCRPDGEKIYLTPSQGSESCEYISLGCWRDTSDRAIPTLEGTDPRLDGDYKSRENPIEKCYQVALSRGFPVFALQNGGWCAGSADRLNTYDRYGPSTTCASDGEGGPWGNEVYRITGQTLVNGVRGSGMKTSSTDGYSSSQRSMKAVAKGQSCLQCTGETDWFSSVCARMAF
uniref:GON domain-containing protein n=1 Tax=Branchiostoma floridae TaxID=7739 RepID=C3ZH52_BRAFL|eukprot:XP_002592188.1 hypothetical protein BRAFLDRAFT_88075 [Branchiostoma floridae]